MSVTYNDIIEAIKALELSNKDVEVHSSLKSFGHVEGGAETVVDALVSTCNNVLMPAFHSVGRVDPPEDDQPEQNGWDYSKKHTDPDTVIPFDPETFGTESDITIDEMGIIPVTLMRKEGTFRSIHPSVSWLANGPDAQWYTADHAADDPNLILKRLKERNGHILLFGVTLTRTTMLHLAEELAGHNNLIRWSLYADGTIRRFRESGCSAGFDNLLPFMADIEKTLQIGDCTVRTFPAEELVEKAIMLINENPQITVCDNEGPCRCKDSASGGPEA